MNLLRCKLCGYEAKQLHQHLKAVHKLNAAEYRHMFGIQEIMQIGFIPSNNNISKINSNYVKKGYNKIKDSLINSKLLSFEEVKSFISINFKKYSGRTKHRTLIKENPDMYSSIIHYTSTDKAKLKFPDRIRLILEYDGDIEKIICKCGRKYTFTKKCRHCAPSVVKFWAGKTHTTNTKLKQRLSTLNYIHNSKGQVSPRYNKKSISILEQKALELNIDDLMHAENGGEFQVLGYFVDGYSPSKNIVIEYDESHHFDQNGNLHKKDIIRQQEIESALGCTFIRIKQ